MRSEIETMRPALTLTNAVLDSIVLLGEFVAVVQNELSVENVDDAANRQVAVFVVDYLLVAHLFTHKRLTNDTILMHRIATSAQKRES